MHRPPLTRLCSRYHLHLSVDIPSSGSLAYHWQKRISLPETYPYCLLKSSVQYDNSRQNGLSHIIHLVSYLNNYFRVQRYGFYFKCQSFIIAHCSLYFFFFFSIRGLWLSRLHISTFLNHIYIFYDLRIHTFTPSWSKFFQFFVFELFLSCQVKEDAKDIEIRRWAVRVFAGAGKPSLPTASLFPTLDNCGAPCSRGCYAPEQ